MAISEELNPYESPTSLDRGRSNGASEVGRRYSLSNRKMSCVFGAIGSLLFGMGLVALVSALFDMGYVGSVSRDFEFYAMFTLFCVVMPLVGAAMISVAVYLWRCDSD